MMRAASPTSLPMGLASGIESFVITELASAKINLALHVRRRRPDGYHELETLFAFLADGDRVTVKRSDAPLFRMTGPFAAQLSTESDNLVLRAARLFTEKFGTDGVLAITLDKHLPVASGIGGGSADAAATLRALARLNDMAVDSAELFVLAERLGADVPACLLCRSAIGTGKGERLDPVAQVAGIPVLLVNPGIAVSTASVFKAWDGVDHGPLPAGPPIEIAVAGRNDLEPPACAIAPTIGEVLEMLGAMPGVMLARMSGSGATCFALFRDAKDCHSASVRIAAERPAWWQLESRLA